MIQLSMVYDVFHLLWLQIFLKDFVLKWKFISNSTSHNLPEILVWTRILVNEAAGVTNLLQKVCHVFHKLVRITSKFLLCCLSEQTDLSLRWFSLNFLYQFLRLLEELRQSVATHQLSRASLWTIEWRYLWFQGADAMCGDVRFFALILV